MLKEWLTRTIYGAREAIRIFQKSHLLKSGITGFDGLIQIFLSMSEGNKPGFKLGRWEIDSLFHHFDKELGEAFRIACLSCPIIFDRYRP